MSENLKPLDLYSEPYAPTGNLGDSGMRKLLGAPSLDLLQTVIRESVQNCCDAAKLGAGPMVTFRLRTLEDQQMQFLTNTVLANVPPDAIAGAALSELRFPRSGDKPIRVLEIVDYNTTGLAGPVRADRLPSGIRYTDFIDFFRNVGTARNTDSGGGTYGFGKSSLYMTSACSTILVDTQTEVVGQPVRRFMGCHIGGCFQLPSEDGHMRPYTGRHWWGLCEGHDPVVDPLENKLAGTAASALGMPARAEDSPGTTVMILAPTLDDESLDIVGQQIVEELLWHFWPRMTRDTPADKFLQAAVEIEGHELEFPKPESWAPLNLYCDALAQIRRRDDSHDGDQVQAIASQRPKRLLGHCATVKGFKAQRTNATGSIARRADSIALMRPVGFVVRYLDGTSLTNESMEWAGVFVVDDDPDTENAFARSEPPAHDDWQCALLSKKEGRTFVKGALRRLKVIADSMADVTQTQSSNAHAEGGTAVRVANCLGSLLGGDNQTNTPIRRRSNSGRQQSRKIASVGAPRFLRIGLEQETPFAEFGIDAAGGPLPCLLKLRPRPVVDGVWARPAKASDGDFLTLPEILSVTGADGQLLLPDSDGHFTLPKQIKSELLVRTTLPIAMTFGLQATLHDMAEDVL